MKDDQNQKIEIPTLAEDSEFLPFYMSKEAAGADLKAYLKNPLIVPPNQSILVPTGIRLAIPEGYEIQIRPRSGLALKHQVTVLNAPGTIDSDYRGEVKVILINHGIDDFIITPGMRIAQIVLAPVMRAHFVMCNELVATERGMGGFGHTGG